MTSLFRKLKSKFWIWILAWNILAFGQGSDTVFQTIWSTQAQSGYDNAVALRQIGQSGHLVNISFSNAPSQTCSTLTGETMQFFLEGSFDNSTWFVIRASFYIFNQRDPAGNLATQIDGYGAYSYIRVRAAWYAGGGVANVFTKCRLNGWYAGSVNGNRQPTDRLLPNQDSFSRYSNAIAAATTTTLITAASATAEIQVWQLQVCTAAANNIDFVGSGAPATSLEGYTFSANGGCVIVPYTGVFHVNTDFGENLQVVTSTAAATRINLIATNQ